MMKKRTVGMFLVMALLLVLIVGCRPSAASEIRTQSFRLSYPNTTTSITGIVFENFAKKVSELSGGKMTIETFPAASLISNSETLDAVSLGNVDFSHFMTSSIVGTIKELTVLEIPGSQPSDKYWELHAATRDLIEQAFNKYGIKYCAPIESGTACILSISGFIKSPDDLKGKACRASGTWVGRAVSAWGGSPVNVALGDISTALERKTIDVCYAGWIVAGPNKFYEAAPYVTWTGIQEAHTGFMMNLDRWNSLNDAEKAVLQEGFDNFMKEIAELAAVQAAAIQKDIADFGGYNYTLTDEENAVFLAVTAALVEEARGISGELGNKIIDAIAAVK